MLDFLALNPLSSTDIIFFIVLGVLAVLCVGVYFLIPVLNKKQYREQRENLKKREAAFQSNIRRTDGSTATAQAAATPEAPAEETALPEADKPSGRGEE